VVVDHLAIQPAPEREERPPVTTMHLLLLLFLLVAGCSAGSSPVQKVLEMMNDMMAKCKKEKQDEKVRFAAFEQFCIGTSKQKANAIELDERDMERAAADSEQAKTDADSLANEIAGHAKDVGAWQIEQNKAHELRAEQKKVFEKQHAEVVDSLASTDAAKRTLEEGNKGAAQASLLELSKKGKVPEQAKQIITSFMQQDPARAFMQAAEDAMGTPQAAAFEGSSGAIIEVVEDLENKLSDEKKELEEREANSLNSYNLQVNSLKGDIKKAGMESEMKASMKAQREGDKASSDGNLADATSTHHEDKKFLSDLTAECTLKSDDFKKRQVMRHGEIKAIEKAIEIMSSDDVAGGAQRTGLTQTAKTPQGRRSFAQLRIGENRNTQHRPSQMLVASFLADRAQRTNSRVLEFVASRANSDPFAKVIGMVKNMIQKLMEDANDEASHKGFCDTEMGTNKVTRDTKTALVSKLDADIEEYTAAIGKLVQQIRQTSMAIAEIDVAMGKALEERQAEKAKNQETLNDSKVAKAATQKAMTVLKEFYDKAATQVDLPESEGPIKYDPRAVAILTKSSGGGALVQEQAQLKHKVPGAPEMENGKYTGMGNGGIIGMLEIIESDFADLISATDSSEAEAVRVHEQFVNDSTRDKAVKNTELTHREDKKTQAESNLQATRRDLKTTHEELQAAVDYYEKLKPSCIEVAMSYQDRVSAREEEIESLQEALNLLSQDGIA